VVYVRKQAAEAYVFNSVKGGRLAGTYQGPKSIANALAGDSKVEKSVRSEYEIFHGAFRLGTLFEVRHAAYIAGRL
jgi:hypothetical protein